MVDVIGFLIFIDALTDLPFSKVDGEPFSKVDGDLNKIKLKLSTFIKKKPILLIFIISLIRIGLKRTARKPLTLVSKGQI